MVRKFPERNFGKFGYTTLGFPFFPEISQNADPFPSGIAGKFNVEF